MACIFERKRVNKPSAWQVIVRVKDQKPIVHTCETLEAAQAFAALTETDLRQRAKADASALEKLRKTDPTLANFYSRKLRDVVIEYAYGSQAQAFKDGKVSPSLRPVGAKRASARPKRDAHPADLPRIGGLRDYVTVVLANVGNTTVAEAKGSWVARYVDKLRGLKSNRGTVYAYATICKHLQLLRAACLAAAARADIEEPRLYFTTKSFPKNYKASRDRRLEFGEHEAIMMTLNSDKTPKGRQWRCLYRLALETAARLQELALAEWPEFKTSGVWVLPAGHTKKNTTRIVSLTPRARRVINLLRAMASQESRYVFHAFGTVSSVSKAWACRAERAGIPDLRFHDLRHEAVTRLMLHPANVRTERIQEMVGHKSTEMLARYTHLRVGDYVGLFDSPPKA